MGGNIAWGSSARGSEAVALMKDKRRTCLLDLILLMAARGHFPSPIFPSRPSTYPLAAVMLRDGGAGLERRTQLELTFGVLLRILFTEAAVAFFRLFFHTTFSYGLSVHLRHIRTCCCTCLQWQPGVAWFRRLGT